TLLAPIGISIFSSASASSLSRPAGGGPRHAFFVRLGFRRGVGFDYRLSLLEHRQEIGDFAFLHLLESALQGVRNGVELIGLWLVRHFANSRIDRLDSSFQGLWEAALLHIDHRLVHPRQGLGDLAA